MQQLPLQQPALPPPHSVALTQDLPLDLPTFTPPEDDLDSLDGTLLHSSVETIWADGRPHHRGTHRSKQGGMGLEASVIHRMLLDKYLPVMTAIN
jgi:hypothetical protein